METLMQRTTNNKPIPIAILIPIYNGVEYLEEALISVFKQTYTHWHIFIGINGHPLGSETYQKVLNTSKNTIFSSKITIKDFGPPGNKSATLNRLVSDVKTTNYFNYVALLDVDDVWLPHKLSSQIPLLRTTPSFHVVGSKCIYFGENDKNDVIPYVPSGDFTDRRIHDFKKQGNPIINSSVIIHIPLAFWNEDTTNGLEDFELWLELRKRGLVAGGAVRFYNCPEVLVKHRMHKDSAFNGTNAEHIDKILARY
jgi:glycosyltransferase involved in cell wall biosynthesis